MAPTAEQIQEVLAAHAYVPEHVVFRSFEAETLLLNLQSGNYHGLNATGGRLLELLSERGADGSVGDSVDQLARECVMDPSEIRADLVGFCLKLEERGLISIEREGG